MRPIGEHGVQLEGLDEISVAVETLRFLGTIPSLPDEHRISVNGLVEVLDGLRRNIYENPEVVSIQQRHTPEGQLPTAMLDVEGILEAQ